MDRTEAGHANVVGGGTEDVEQTTMVEVKSFAINTTTTSRLGDRETAIWRCRGMLVLSRLLQCKSRSRAQHKR